MKTKLDFYMFVHKWNGIKLMLAAYFNCYHLYVFLRLLYGLIFIILTNDMLLKYTTYSICKRCNKIYNIVIKYIM